MNDSFSGKNGKVKVMYVRSDDDSSSNKDKRSGKGRQDKGRAGNPRSDSPRPGGTRKDNPRRERGPQNSDRPRRSEPKEDDYDSPYSSPWKTVSRPPVAVEQDEQEGQDGEQASWRTRIDPEQIRRQRAEETRVYGETACKALYQNRPESIVRAWFVQSVTPRFREALRWMAANRKAYHVVDDAELTKASGTEHHGGVCFIIKRRKGFSTADYLEQPRERDCVLALDGIANPHNLGAMMRSCAHFGVNGVLLNDPALLESGAAVRTAEGGAEHVQAIDGEDIFEALDEFRKAGYAIVTTSNNSGTPLEKATLPEKVVLVLKQDDDNLAESIGNKNDLNVSISGTGKVRGLNISVAAGILLAEWNRQNAQ